MTNTLQIKKKVRNKNEIRQVNYILVIIWIINKNIKKLPIVGHSACIAQPHANPWYRQAWPALHG